MLSLPADIAILRAADSGRWLSGVEPYSEIQQEYELAQDFITYGFPERTIGLEANNPDPLVFKGPFHQPERGPTGRLQVRRLGDEHPSPGGAER